MSANLSSVASIEFDSMVKHAYAQKGLLKPAVTIRNNVVGDSYKFRNMGKGLANQKATSADVVPMGVTYDFAVATLANWNAPEYTDIFDQAEVNFDEKQELADTIAGALGRRSDQLVIDAMDAVTPTTIAHGSAALTMAKVIEAQVALRGQGVPNSNLFAAVNRNVSRSKTKPSISSSSSWLNQMALSRKSPCPKFVSRPNSQPFEVSGFRSGFPIKEPG